MMSRCFSSNTIRRPFSFRAADLQIEKVENDGLKGVKDMSFGATHSAHMFYVDSIKGKWGTPKIVPYAPIPIDPFNSTFHYSVSCFEGMKAYLDNQNRIRLFRPDQNMKRFASACERLSLDPFDTNEFLKCLVEYTKVERNWIPSKRGEALYLRPFAFSMENTLVVKHPESSRVMIVASPVAGYFSKEVKPIKLGICREFERGFPKSAAGFKISPNYGPTIKIGLDLHNSVGADQVLWLYNDRILEVGACNIFFIIKDENGDLELVTAPLDGSILPGVTRSSVLERERERKRFKVSERIFTLTEVKKAFNEGRLVEIFGTGTAVVVLPVEGIGSILSCSC